jgi:hypothetical protein
MEIVFITQITATAQLTRKGRLQVQWDDGSEGGYEVRQLSTEEQAKAKGL